MAINWNISKSDRATIGRIVDRAMALYRKRGIKGVDRLTLDMDISATHANGNALDLERLLAADDFNFMHDVSGIGRHIDRETAQLTNNFLPRFSRPKKKLRGRTSRIDANAVNSNASSQRLT